jgi:thioesterase domain-containing protein
MAIEAGRQEMADLYLLEQTSHRTIPIVREMGFIIAAYDIDSLTIKAPLHRNINHHQTAFAGSLNAAATIACWAYVYLMLEQRGIEAEIVIQQGAARYDKPVIGDFEAICHRPDAHHAERFLTMVDRKGKGRIQLAADVTVGDQIAARFEGVYVASIVH